MYSVDLAYIHEAGFGDFARQVAPEIGRLIRNAGIARGRIVEFGCGSGAVAGHLHALGYDVRAFDISPAMIRLARKNAPGVRFIVASVGTARLPHCDAIVGVGEVVTYVPGGAATLRRFFSRAHAALHPGGALVFDFIESARRRTYDTKTISGRNWAMAVKATFDETRGVLTRRMTMTRRTARGLRRSRETHRVRIYDRRLMRRMLKQCGFTVRMSRSFGCHRLLAGDVAVIAIKRAL
jgi:SAM-dependent methyltransferase